MLVMGTHSQNKQPFLVPERDLLYHSAIIGQSGSGKSYFIARLLEELVLRTKARVVIIDPNGDFGRFCFAREEEFWRTGPFASRLKEMRAITGTLHKSYDEYALFNKVWNERRFEFLNSKHVAYMPPLRNDANRARLLLHWKWLESEQDFLLNVDPILYPRTHQGIVTCFHYMGNNIQNYPRNFGYSLRDLEMAAQDFAERKVAMADYPEALTLREEDWLAVRLQFRQLRKRFYRLWHDFALKGKDSAPIDLCGHILNGFRRPPEPWQLCIVELAAMEEDHIHLAANATFYRVWKCAVNAWRGAQERSEALTTAALKLERAGLFDQTPYDRDAGQIDDHEGLTQDDFSDEHDDLGLDQQKDDEAVDTRVPTIIVIDEAHHFAPQEPTSPLQARVSDKIATIAAEGRKYGLFLFLSTQRPEKLRKGLLAECENSCLLRIQSKVERSHAAGELGIPVEIVDRVATIDKGEALMIGRWVAGPSTVRFAPARTMLGGAGLDEEYWIESPGD